MPHHHHHIGNWTAPRVPPHATAHRAQRPGAVHKSTVSTAQHPTARAATTNAHHGAQPPPQSGGANATPLNHHPQGCNAQVSSTSAQRQSRETANRRREDGATMAPNGTTATMPDGTTTEGDDGDGSSGETARGYGGTTPGSRNEEDDDERGQRTTTMKTYDARQLQRRTTCNDDEGAQQCDDDNDNDGAQQYNDDDQGAPKMPPYYPPGGAKNPGIAKSYNTDPSGYTPSVATASGLVPSLDVKSANTRRARISSSASSLQRLTHEMAQNLKTDLPLPPSPPPSPVWGRAIHIQPAAPSPSFILIFFPSQRPLSLNSTFNSHIYLLFGLN